jgi:hypothetical protein
MMGFGPPEAIDAPPRLPLPYGLFSAVSLAEVASERWENGVTWEALTCDPVNIVVGDCDAPEGFPKQFPENGPGIGEADAFTVYGTYKCSGPQAVADAQVRSREVLLAREEQAAEGRLWRNMAMDNPTTVASSDAVDTLGALEKFIGDTYGSLGVIHGSRNAVTTWIGRGLVVVRGGRLETVLGTPVVAGSGYPGTAEATDPAADPPVFPAPAAGTEWVAASPALFGYRSEVFEPTTIPGDLMDRRNNDVFGVAERNYLIGYEPCGVGFAALPLGCC